jgi:hypothetical protein
MRHRDPAKAVEVLDLLLEFFCGRRELATTRFSPAGRQPVRRKHHISGDGTGFYLQHAMPDFLLPVSQSQKVMSFNDACKHFGEMRTVITLARAMALLDRRKRRARERLAA